MEILPFDAPAPAPAPPSDSAAVTDQSIVIVTSQQFTMKVK